MSNTKQEERYKRGFIASTGYTNTPGVQADWYNYLEAILKNPYSYLTSAIGITSNDNTYQGILSPIKDSNGLIRKKYDAIISHYKTKYNIDLQRIGNGDK
ncbi:MAG: hypothetical protein IPH58_11620 [Sphingobacteriales bacterium]|jgi:hypothetical protein|nr:hypothetical protein [Sphingobacteriales bacterium]